MNVLLDFMRTLSEILTAGIAITAFSLMIYAFSFNLRVRVARAFALILVCVVINFTAQSLATTVSAPNDLEFWQRVQWVGVVILPAAYLQFSDAALALSGKPSRGRRIWTVRLAYAASAFFLVLLPFGWLVGRLEFRDPFYFLQPTIFTDLFVVYFGGSFLLTWYNLIRAYRRATASASRRRLGYLLAGSLAPAIGSFPFLQYSPYIIFEHPLIFWTFATVVDLLVGGLIVVMAYSVAFFGVAWPDRVVRARLLKWIMRGPFTASLTLGVATLARRGGNVLGWNGEILSAILVPGTILLCEHLITLFTPLGERLLFFGNDREDLEALKRIEAQLVTRNDLRQFLEMVLAATSDLLQASGGYVIGLNEGSSELVAVTGKTRFDGREEDINVPLEVIEEILPGGSGSVHTFQWAGDTLIPLFNGSEDRPDLIGLLGVSGATRAIVDRDQEHSLDILSRRVAMALRDRRIQEQIFITLDSLTPQVGLIQRLRAAGRYDREGVLASEENLEGEENLIIWVKEALTHYWGGPRLTSSPLMQFHVVQDAVKEYDGNQANALRAILRRAIDHVRPEGERKFTAEWILFNILDMKFVEGKKVREIALRLAMSEADLYRKQRVAIESVARAISEMESQAAQQGVNSKN